MKKEKKYHTQNKIKEFLLTSDEKKSNEFIKEFADNVAMKFFFRDKDFKNKVVASGVDNAMVNRLSYKDYEQNINPFLNLSNLIKRGIKKHSNKYKI